MIVVDAPLGWRSIAAVAHGAPLSLSPAAAARVAAARALVESLVATGQKAYGVNTGVGALCNVVVDAPRLRQLSRNIVMSHAVGVGSVLGKAPTRAIIAAAVNQFALGYSGVRPVLLAALLRLLDADCVPEIPSQGSVGYLTHMAHVALVLLGEGYALHRGRRVSGAQALRDIGLAPLVLEAKEGLSLVNGTPCSAGLAALALLRSERLLAWADAAAAMSVENLHGQLAAFDAEVLALRRSRGLDVVGANLRALLAGSEICAAALGARTQDALSLRAVPQVHGAARDLFDHVSGTVERELAAVTDNPVVTGTADEPRAHSEAHAVGAAIGLAADALGTAMAAVAAMSERRIDRLVNPLVSGLPAFLAEPGGASSGFMIAQYTAAALVADNRRRAAPASLDGGVTSGLQEDHLAHATPAVAKWLKILDNGETVIAIEILAAAQAYDLQTGTQRRGRGTEAIYRAVRARVPCYRDDRPLACDIESVRGLLGESPP
jgi:histidine ammonia-lyase